MAVESMGSLEIHESGGNLRSILVRGIGQRFPIWIEPRSGSGSGSKFKASPSESGNSGLNMTIYCSSSVSKFLIDYLFDLQVIIWSTFMYFLF